MTISASSYCKTTVHFPTQIPILVGTCIRLYVHVCWLDILVSFSLTGEYSRANAKGTNFKPKYQFSWNFVLAVFQTKIVLIFQSLFQARY